MEFNDSTNLNGIIQECEMLVFGGNYGAISGNSSLLKRFTALANIGLDRAETTVLGADGRWQFDDSNYTQYPIGTTTLVDGQQDYTLSVSHIKIIAVEARDSNGNYRRLQPIDQADIQRKNIALSEFMKEDGMPQFYDKSADGLFLYPAPATANVTTSAGLKVYFQRGASYFVSTDTTKTPGFDSRFHYLIPLWASYLYTNGNDMYDKADRFMLEIDKQTKSLSYESSKRDVDDRPKLRAKRKNYK